MKWRKFFKKNRTLYECYVCNGKGKNKKDEPCSKCLGSETLDWIENIIGKHNRNIMNFIFKRGK